MLGLKLKKSCAAGEDPDMMSSPGRTSCVDSEYAVDVVESRSGGQLCVPLVTCEHDRSLSALNWSGCTRRTDMRLRRLL